MKAQSSPRSKRFINALVDMIIILIATAIVSFIIRIFTWTDYTTLVYFPVFFLYYFLMEYLTGTTVGKIITNTKVYFRHNKNRWFWVLLRTLLRFNPLDSYSYLCGTNQGTHDVVSQTGVVEAGE